MKGPGLHHLQKSSFVRLPSVADLCYADCCPLQVLLCFLLVSKAIEKLTQKITGKRRFLMLRYEVGIVLAASPQDSPCQCISVLTSQWHQPPIQGTGRDPNLTRCSSERVLSQLISELYCRTQIPPVPPRCCRLFRDGIGE